MTYSTRQSHGEPVCLDRHVIAGAFVQLHISFEKQFGKIMKICKNVPTLSFSSWNIVLWDIFYP